MAPSLQNGGAHPPAETNGTHPEKDDGLWIRYSPQVGFFDTEGIVVEMDCMCSSSVSPGMTHMAMGIFFGSCNPRNRAWVITSDQESVTWVRALLHAAVGTLKEALILYTRQGDLGIPGLPRVIEGSPVAFRKLIIKTCSKYVATFMNDWNFLRRTNGGRFPGTNALAYGDLHMELDRTYAHLQEIGCLVEVWELPYGALGAARDLARSALHGNLL